MPVYSMPSEESAAVIELAADETVTIIQHPRGRPEEISLRDNRVVRADAVVAHDCSLPASLHTLGGPQPIALRVTLDRPDPAPTRTSIPPSLLEIPMLPRVTEGLNDLIERKLRNLLGPVVSRLLASSGNSGES
jgi:hypothetical protein